MDYTCTCLMGGYSEAQKESALTAVRHRLEVGYGVGVSHGDVDSSDNPSNQFTRGYSANGEFK